MTKFIVWLLLLCQILGNMCIAIVFEEKYLSCYISLLDEISLSGRLYFMNIGQYVYRNCF